MSGFAEETTPYCVPATKTEFLRWVQGREGQFEFKNGQVIMQAGGTRRHGWIAARFIRALASRLDDALWAVGTTDNAVEIGEDVRYPDVVVERLSGSATSLSTSSPVVLVEALSPSSAETDKIVKLAEYTSVASLECYIIASQEEPGCLVWQRGGGQRSFPNEPAVVGGLAASIAIAALSVVIPLEEIYRHIPLGPARELG